MPNHHWNPRCERPEGLVEPAGIDPTGLAGPTRRQAQGGRFRQTSPGLYVPVTVDGSIVEQRILEQSRRIRSYGAVTAWAALRWRGATFFDGTAEGGTRILPVTLVVGLNRIRGDARVLVSQEQLAPGERELVDGVYCTTVPRALFDEMRRAPSLREAVVAMDMAAAAGLISVALMAEYVAHRPAWTGVPRVRESLTLACDDSRSPQEVRMRLVWQIDAGLPRPLCNRPVFDLSGRLLGVPDLLDPEAGVVGEYDGADHKDLRRHRVDVAREGEFREHGLEYFTVVGGDLAERGKVVDRMLAARRRALSRPPQERQWTLTPPPWWRPGVSLDARLREEGRIVVRPGSVG